MKRTAQLEIYLAADGFRWRLKAANGAIVGESGEAYATKAGALRAVERLRQIMAADVPVIQRETP